MSESHGTFWLGAIAEAIMTCLITTVCSYPRTILFDAVLITFFASMLIRSVLEVKSYRRPTSPLAKSLTVVHK